MLEHYLNSLSDTELKQLVHLYLGDDNTLLSRQKMIQTLSAFFTPEAVNNLLLNLTDEEILILSIISLKKVCSLQVLAKFTSFPLPLLLNYLYYLKIKLLVVEEDKDSYSLNPIFVPERVITYFKLFQSEKSETLNEVIDRNTIIAILNYFYSTPCPTHAPQIEKYLKSSAFTSRFPKLDSATVHDVGKFLLNYLIHHNEIEAEDGHYVLKASVFLKYLKLNTLSLLSLFLFDEITDETIYFLTLLSKLGCIKAQELDTVIGKIKELTGISLNISSANLFLFNIAAEKDFGINLNCCYKETYSSFIQYNSDLSSFYQNELSLSSILPLIATCDKVDILSIYTINKQCITKALDYFSSLDSLIEVIHTDGSTLPPLVISRLNSWYENYSRLSFVEGVVMYTNEAEAKIIDSLPLLQIHIVKRLSSTVYLMKKETQAQWRRILLYAGFENLSGIKGEKVETIEPLQPLFIKEDANTTPLTKRDFNIEIGDKDEKLKPLFKNHLLLSNEQLPTLEKRKVNSIFPFDVKAKQVLLEQLLKQKGRDVLVSLNDEDFYAVVLDVYKENSLAFTKLFNLESHEVITTAVSKIYTLTLI